MQPSRRDPEPSPKACPSGGLAANSCPEEHEEAPAMPDRAVIGDAPRRREDARFVTGHGAYLDDLRFDGLVHGVLLRSPHAHAEITDIDAAAARVAPGVLAVLTGADADADGLRPMRPTVEANVQTGAPFAFAPQPLLAREKV